MDRKLFDKHEMDYISLFCGCGGFDQGLTEAGWHCRLAVDIDDHALRLYSDNFPSHVVLKHDLSLPLPNLVNLREALRRGVLVGGAPCQDYSTACKVNKRQQRERARLTIAFADHCAALDPYWAVFENVRNSKNSTEFGEFVERLKGQGYSVKWRVLSMSELGMAQNRHRLILLANKSSLLVESAWRHVDRLLADMQARGPRETMRSLFSRHRLPMPGNHLYYGKPGSHPKQKSIFTLDGPSPTIRGRVRPLPSSYGPVEKDDTQDLGDVFALTQAHAAALQGFAPLVKWLYPPRKSNTCIGNAVPPPLGHLIGQAISHAMSELDADTSADNATERLLHVHSDYDSVWDQ